MTDAFLLDTHIALWLDSGDDRLRHSTRALIDGCWRNGGTIFLSAVTAWEIPGQAANETRIDDGEASMKAVLKGQVVAESDDIVACDGYQYFPPAAVRREWLEKAEKTESDRACPHGVQFYDVVIGGERHPRNAWCYEQPLSSKQQVAWRFGFWKDVEIR